MGVKGQKCSDTAIEGQTLVVISPGELEKFTETLLKHASDLVYKIHFVICLKLSPKERIFKKIFGSLLKSGENLYYSEEGISENNKWQHFPETVADPRLLAKRLAPFNDDISLQVHRGSVFDFVLNEISLYPTKMACSPLSSNLGLVLLSIFLSTPNSPNNLRCPENLGISSKKLLI